jgi:hypothetical protein
MAEEIKLAGGRGQWVEGAWMKDTMVDHVLLRRLGRPSRRTGGEVESSPWVSTCGNLDWAIWEIARRLSQGLPSVRLTIIRQKHHDAGPLNHHDTANTPGALTPNIDVESSGAVNPNPDASWGKAGKLGKVGKVGKVRELKVAPAVVLGRHIPRIISERKKEVYSSAAARAREAGEVLVYGRVFSESVLADLTWTRNVSWLHCTCTVHVHVHVRVLDLDLDLYLDCTCTGTTACFAVRPSRSFLSSLLSTASCL